MIHRIRLGRIDGHLFVLDWLDTPLKYRFVIADDMLTNSDLSFLLTHFMERPDWITTKYFTKEHGHEPPDSFLVDVVFWGKEDDNGNPTAGIEYNLADQEFEPRSY